MDMERIEMCGVGGGLIPINEDKLFIKKNLSIILIH